MKERNGFSVYNPCPIDVSDIRIPHELDGLVESLAQNVHDTWARGRMNQGWTWGEVRNDLQKTNPCLVPYEKLPESEKDYDRETAVATLKAILKLGFKIEICQNC